MIEQFDHYISKSIRLFYRRRIIFPILYLILLLVIGILYPVSAMFFPRKITEENNMEQLYTARDRYVSVTTGPMYFTGYTKDWLFGTMGYYYYTMMDDRCVIVLLNPQTCKQGLPTIETLTFRAKLLHDSKSMDKLLEHLAQDLSWSESGITGAVSRYMLSEPDATDLRTRFFMAVYALSGLYAVGSILVYIIYLIDPVYSRPCQRLRLYGNPRKILAKAEKELATLPQLATEDMFITEHYFIETSGYGVAIVPIKQILWIYKYSTLHKFLWHHFSISYTLHITAKRRQYIRCPKNIKSDIDGIIDYLAEANHDILVGFSEENRLRVEELQGDMALLKKFTAFLSKKV